MLPQENLTWFKKKTKERKTTSSYQKKKKKATLSYFIVDTIFFFSNFLLCSFAFTCVKLQSLKTATGFEY